MISLLTFKRKQQENPRYSIFQVTLNQGSQHHLLLPCGMPMNTGWFYMSASMLSSLSGELSSVLWSQFGSSIIFYCVLLTHSRISTSLIFGCFCWNPIYKSTESAVSIGVPLCQSKFQGSLEAKLN